MKLKVIVGPKSVLGFLFTASERITNKLKILFVLAFYRLGHAQKIKVCYFPSIRKRYLTFLDFKDGSLMEIFIWNPSKSDFKILNLVKQIPVVISSDFVINGFDFYHIDLTSNPIQLFVWNAEEEVMRNLEVFDPNSIELLTFFGNTISGSEALKGLNASYPVYRAKKGRIFRARNETILFAGQVNCDLFQNILNGNPILQQEKSKIIEKILKSDHQFLFDSDYFKASLALHEKIALRHFGVNFWRERMLQDLEDIFGQDLVLIGGDFLKSKFSKATLIQPTENLDKWYLGSRVNLDLGSQCGLEYVYPRTLEVRAISPSSLFHFERNSPKPSWVESKYWRTAEDIAQQLRST